MTKQRDVIHLLLRPIPTSPFRDDPLRGLRGLLKRLLRDHGFVCMGYGDKDTFQTDTSDTEETE